ncbi:MAG: 2OG-Fe(II) oxygenase [Burkholderiaceae bacterium]
MLGRLPDAQALADAMTTHGYARVPALLELEQCRAIRALYDDAGRFRSRIVMARHGFGRGEYQYFARPLPPLVVTLRERAYALLVDLANAWQAALGLNTRFESAHAAFLKRCHAAGQTRPTPLLLKYGEGDENRLHQDVYGELVFPFQIAILLSDPHREFDGGEFVLTEQRPRQQSRVIVPPMGQGDAVVFPVRHRPVAGVRGFYRATVRHGVGEVRRGERYVLGIIFHDAT